MRETATGGSSPSRVAKKPGFLRGAGRDATCGGGAGSATGAAGMAETGSADAGITVRRHQALLEFRRRRQAQMRAHRLFGAIKAVQPGAIIMDDAAALDAGQDIVACLGLGACRRPKRPHRTATREWFSDRHALAPNRFALAPGHAFWLEFDDALRANQWPPPEQADIAAIFAQASLLHQQGRLKDAAALYRHVLRADPAHFEAHHMLGLLYAQQGEFLEAVKEIGHALKINPEHQQALSNFGNVLRALGQREEALLSYDAAISGESR